MIKNFDLLADRLKGIKYDGEDLTPGKLIELHSDENEIDLEFSEGSFLTDSELEDYKERVGKESAKTGAKTIVEMEVKKYRNDLGLDFEGKTIENLVNAVKEKTLKEAKIPANQKVEELQSSLEKLQNQYQTEITEKQTLIEQLNGTIKSEKVNNTLLGSIPKDLKGVNQKQALTLLKTEYEFDIEDGNVIVKQGGQILKDKFEKTLSYTDVINNYVVNNNWLDGSGRGGDSDKNLKGGKFETKHDLFKYMEQNNIDIESSEGEEMIKKFNESQNS